MTISNVVTPKLNDVVNVVRVEINNKGKVVKSDASQKQDKIQAVYSETELTAKNNMVFNVRLFSGDTVKIMRQNENWVMVA